MQFLCLQGLIVVFKCVHLVNQYFYIKNELGRCCFLLVRYYWRFLLASLGHVYIHACIMVVHVAGLIFFFLFKIFF